MIYAVFKESVYRHECGGVYSTLEKACDAARMLIWQECDDHHRFDVVPFVLDEVPRGTSDRWLTIQERPALATFERRADVVHQTK